ncbi:MAG: hypothetical protein ABIK67_02695 [candidate division WOR-3 bacterium]
MKKFLISLSLFFLTIGWAITDSVDFSRWVVKIQDVATTQGMVENVDLALKIRELIWNLAFDGDFTVSEYLTMNPRIARRFERNPILARPVETKFLSDGSVLAEYEVTLTGTILSTLLPKTGGGVPLVPLCCPICKRPWPDTLEIPEGVTLIPQELEPITNYTGFIIDARGLKLTKALFPKILNEDGKEVYGLSFVQSNYAQELGLVSYVKTIAEAFRSERVGANPLRIDALRTSGRTNSDIVITNSDAQRMHQSQRNLKLLERCQVVIITDE